MLIALTSFSWAVSYDDTLWCNAGVSVWYFPPVNKYRDSGCTIRLRAASSAFGAKKFWSESGLFYCACGSRTLGSAFLHLNVLPKARTGFVRAAPRRKNTSMPIFELSYMYICCICLLWLQACSFALTAWTSWCKPVFVWHLLSNLRDVGVWRRWKPRSGSHLRRRGDITADEGTTRGSCFSWSD